MRLNSKNIKETLEEAKQLLDKGKNISPALRAVIGLLLIFVETMLNRLGLNSSNSSKPPSTDKKKGKKNNRPKSNKKPGGQPAQACI